MTMIERVAHQLEPQAWAALGTGDTLAYKNRRVSSMRKARAAIEAVRYSEDGSNCPEAVRIAGEETYAENGDARAIFNAMIDAALKDEA